jgi:hypothetical protein
MEDIQANSKKYTNTTLLRESRPKSSKLRLNVPINVKKITQHSDLGPR